MKKVFLALSVASLSLSLAGCGGGGSDNDSGASGTVNASVNQTFYMVDYDYKKDKNTYVLDTKKLEVKNGVVTQDEDPLDQYALTKDALYPKGYKFKGTSQASNLTNWTIYELPNIGAKVTFEEVFLNNQTIYSTILPGYKDYLNYLIYERAGTVDGRITTLYSTALSLGRMHATEKFASGSSCLRIKKLVPLENNFYFSFDATAENQLALSYDQQLANVQNLKKLETADNKIDIQSGKWANNYRWIKLKTDYKATPEFNEEFAFIEFNGKLYHAEVENSAAIDVSSYLTKAKQLLKTSTDADEQAELKLTIAHFEQGCLLYNETAAKQIVIYTR